MQLGKVTGLNIIFIGFTVLVAGMWMGRRVERRQSDDEQMYMLRRIIFRESILRGNDKNIRRRHVSSDKGARFVL